MGGAAAGQPSGASVDVGQEPPAAGAIGRVFGPKGLSEQALLGLDAHEHNNEHQDGDHDAHASAEGQSPAKHENEQAEVARVANYTVKPGGDQPVSRLDGDQPAEAP